MDRIGGLATSRDSTVAGDFNRVYGADVHLQFYERLVFDSHLLRSETPGRRGHDYARQLEVAWREEELTVAGGYNEIQPQFNPEVGLLRRGDNTRYDGTFSWLPRIDSSDVIRNLVLGTDVEYFESATTKQIETRTQRVNAGVAFENNGSVTSRSRTPSIGWSSRSRFAHRWPLPRTTTVTSATQPAARN